MQLKRVTGGKIMTEYNSKERLLRELKNKRVDRTPAVCFTQTATIGQMEQTGSYWPDAHKNLDDMVKLAEAGHNILGFESIRVPFDCTAEPELLGCEVKYGGPHRPPSVQAPSIRTKNELEDLKDYCFDSGEVSTVQNAIKKLSDKYSDVPIISSMLGPVTLAENLNGSDFFINMAREDEFVSDLLEFASDFNIEYAKRMVSNGSDCIVMLDPVSGGELLGRDFYENYALNYQKKVVDAVNDLDIPCVLHICGNNDSTIDLINDTGADGISLGQKTDIAKAVDNLGSPDIIGNIDPTHILCKGDKETISSKVDELMQMGVDIPAPGCAIVSETPDENIKAMVDTIKNKI